MVKFKCPSCQSEQNKAALTRLYPATASSSPARPSGNTSHINVDILDTDDEEQEDERCHLKKKGRQLLQSVNEIKDMASTQVVGENLGRFSSSVAVYFESDKNTKVHST